MARKNRQKAVSGIYHVCMRGINHQCIFEDEEDYYRFISTLQYVKQQYRKNGEHDKDLYTLYAYCLMSNHVHLLIREWDDPIGDIIRKIADSYSYYFNQKYGRDGHFFKDRFRSEPVENFNYFLTLLRYIHRNPVAGHLDGVFKVSDYEYSSWAEYISPESVPIPICDTRATLKRISIVELEELVNQEFEDDVSCIDIETETTKRPSDNAVMQEFMKLTGNMLVSEFQQLDKKEIKRVILSLRQYGASIRQVERLTGIARGIIQELKI